MKGILVIIFFLLSTVLLSGGAVCLASPLPDEVSRILARLSQGDEETLVRLPARPPLSREEAVLAFYRLRDGEPAWVGNLGLRAGGHELIEFLRGVGDLGLCSDHYHLAAIEPLLDLSGDSLRHGVLFDPGYFALLELMLTDAFFGLAADLAGESPESGREISTRDLLRLLNRSLAKGDLTATLLGLQPDRHQFADLLVELQRLRRLSALGGWPAIPAGPTLRPGMRDDRVPLVRQRLLLDGDLDPGGDWDSLLYDPETVLALKSFQRRHGIADDGVIGPITLTELNRPVEERIRQVEINLVRWRNENRDYRERYVQVNIAAYRLDVIELGETVMSMPVVVGTPYRKTPSFSASMRYIEFAPFWYVPPTILREDKLPVIRRDPGWLKRHHYEIVRWGRPTELVDPMRINWRRIRPENFPGLLRQRPGPWNPLGRVKFMFPNRYSVYLHDTDSPNLFARLDRTYSSGCIRIERPLDLALYLLRAAGWDCDRIIEAMERSEPLRVDLPEPVQVHIVYWTAWADAGGRMHYRNDIYQRDADLELAWQRRLADETEGWQLAKAGAPGQNRSLSQ
ncbi:MAG: peptidoglycan-binding protein [Deltaproteobacteria bacterium]|nr:MAG: peptidoglycan-binding protein [Deltaproteobacteria bacterium]